MDKPEPLELRTCHECGEHMYPIYDRRGDKIDGKMWCLNLHCNSYKKSFPIDYKGL